MVLRHFGGTERASYAHSLIDMAERGRFFSVMHSYFSKNAAEERIIAIMKYNDTGLVCDIIGHITTCVLAVGFTHQSERAIVIRYKGNDCALCTVRQRHVDAAL